MDLDTTPTGAVADLGDLAQRPSVQSALAAMREFLGMDVAYTSHLEGENMALLAVDGDGESFSISEGLALPSEQTYCHGVLNGSLPSVNADIRGDARTASMPVTEIAGIGAFTSVPLRFADGRLYGTLCAASHDAMPSLGERELQFLHVFARIVSDQLEREELLDQTRQLEAQASAAATLMAAVQARDSYTGHHSQAVVGRAGAVARHLGLGATRSRTSNRPPCSTTSARSPYPTRSSRSRGP